LHVFSKALFRCGYQPSNKTSARIITGSGNIVKGVPAPFQGKVEMSPFALGFEEYMLICRAGEAETGNAGEQPDRGLAGRVARIAAQDVGQLGEHL
jgi:hypothetical protein